MIPRLAVRTATSAVLIALTFLAACSDAVAPEERQVNTIWITPTSHSVIVGQQATLHATPRDASGDALDRPVVWTSENENLAKVSAEGVVTALKVGEVGIRAASGGRFALAVVTILPTPPVPVADVRLSFDQEIQLPWNGAAEITATPLDADGNVLEGRTVQWISSRSSVATISPSGRIVAISAGTAVITAVIDGMPSSVGVRVLAAPVTDVTIESFTTGLEVGEILTFSARITRENGDSFYAATQWTSDAPSVARVTHTDLTYAAIEGMAEGEATLTASFEGKSASRTVRVAVSPTHDLIYTKYTGSAAEIYLLGIGLHTDIPEPVKLNTGNASRDPSPSPDGSQFVFSVTQPYQTGEGIQNDLYIVNRNGTNMRWLTRMPGVEDSPKWSPDGTKILFHGVVDGRADIYTINVDGTELFNVTASTPADMTDRREPAWSPDGRKVAFVGAVSGQHKLWVIDARGTNARQLTTDAGFDVTPTWSPDGASIAFVRYDAASPANGDDIMIVSAQGGAAMRYAIVGDQRTPAWSPDGRYIAFSGSAVAGSGHQQLATMRADGTGMRVRTFDPTWRGGYAPAWIARR